MGLLDSAAKANPKAESGDLDYTYDTPPLDYEHGRMLRSHKNHHFMRFGLLNQQLEMVPQSTLTGSAGMTDNAFRQYICGYDHLGEVLIWPFMPTRCGFVTAGPQTGGVY